MFKQIYFPSSQPTEKTNKRRSPDDEPLFQAVPLYTKADLQVASYFRDHIDVIDAMTGSVLIVVMPREISAEETAWLLRIFDQQPDEARYPGLVRSQLPCLWLEDGLGGHAVISLSNSVVGPERILAGLTTVCTSARSTSDAIELFDKWLEDEGFATSPVAFAIKEKLMSKSTERLLSTLFGGGFLIALLIIAIFIPDPTPQQYNIFRIVIAVAAAGFVSMFPGFINVEIGKWVKAGGALAVFVLVFFYDPAQLIAPNAKSSLEPTTSPVSAESN